MLDPGESPFVNEGDQRRHMNALLSEEAEKAEKRKARKEKKKAGGGGGGGGGSSEKDTKAKVERDYQR